MVASSPALGMIPRTLRAEQLKRLSFLCGLPLRGRKEELIARLTAASNIAVPLKSQSTPVVLSIDLGIKNLAFSLLTPLPSSHKTDAKLRKCSGANQAPSFLSTSPPAIKLHAWQRLSLLDGPASPPAQSGDGDTLDIDTTTGVFAPAALAKTANAFLQKTVLRLKPLPTHILIERQRWRSGGGPAIQEWTVRVNTLEAILHASLRTLRDVKVWEGEVLSIRPERVGQLFLDADKLGARHSKKLEGDEIKVSANESGRKRTNSPKTSAEAKKLKIDLLGRWLGQGDLIVRPGNLEAGHMLDAYREALKGIKRSRPKRVVEQNEAEGKHLTLDKKLDDLTDSLLQGMAWLRWQENVALLRLEGGVDQLLG
ncbi:mitochondrial resolvase Ydc2 [Xylariaceae sp. AK1471]|nr:mitochondrial resolvase Ydc2 [Xylariaceae sp. AK1471]